MRADHTGVAGLPQSIKGADMEPEWSGNPNMGRILALILIGGGIAFFFMVWVFAWYM